MLHLKKAKYFHTHFNPTLSPNNHQRTGSGWLGWAGPRASGLESVSRLSHVTCLETIMPMVWRLYAGVGGRQSYKYHSLLKSSHSTIFFKQRPTSVSIFTNQNKLEEYCYVYEKREKGENSVKLLLKY